jgi:hypothetical protein
LRYAVIDAAEGAPPPTVRPIDALDDVLSSDLRAEMLVPRTCDGNFHDQRSPALATVHLPPGSALAIAWTDYGKTLGAGTGEPDVVVHYAPTHLPATAGAPQSLTETWSGPTGSALPSRWTTDVAAPGTWTQQLGEAELGSTGAPVTSFALVNDHTAKNVDVVTTFRMGYPQYEGVIVRADDSPTPRNYLAAVITTQKATTWRVYSVVDGVGTNLLTYPVPKSFYDTGIGANVDHRLRFRAVTNPDGSLFLGMKVWRVGAAEPANWLVSTSPPLPVSDPTVQALGNVAGRFGLFASVLTANGGRMNFDDFRATFFEGSAGGDLDVVPNQYPLLLRRDVATYRQCSPGSPCAVTTGCCMDDADCENGLACSRWQSEGLGEGSHASVCVAEHCANSAKDADEVRADCGGADCKQCDCTSTIAPGAAGYCSVSCQCGQGEYPCSLNAQCLPGLICGKGTAELYGGAYGVSACIPPHCMNRIKDADEVKPDCGGACGGGDCSNVCPQPNGSYGHCRPYCTCGTGHGNCAQDDDCYSGLVCAFRATRYGLPSNTQVCVPPSCQNNVRDIALGETGTDCGGACGCNGCPAGCQGLPAAQGDTITIPTTTPHTESFDGIGTADVATLPLAWRIDKQANPRTLGTYAAAGTTTLTRSGAAMDASATNSIYNFGAGVAASGPGHWLDSADRALGWLASGASVSQGGTKSGNLYVQLQAPATTDINGLTISYNVEKYRRGSTAPGWKVQLYYSLDGANWANAGSAFTTSFSNDADVVGYDPAPGSSTSVSGNIPPYVLRGNPLYLAWSYTTSSATSADATSAQALAVDDVSIVGIISQ